VGLIADTYDSMRAVGRSRDGSVTITLGARLTLAAYQSEQKAAIDEAVERAQAAW
jgi:hypothetical protein